MTMTERNPTMVAECGCPYDPEYDEGSLGWHLTTNHLTRHQVTRRPDMIGWNLRRPTIEECEIVGRETAYAAGDARAFMLDDGDTVVETYPEHEAQAKLAEAFEAFGRCDVAHVIPAGVYLEE